MLNRYSRTLEELLSKCLHGKTQNQNKSLNTMIWNRILKETYVGYTQFEIGVFDAIAHFNIGSTAAFLVFEKLNINPGENTLNECSNLNIARISNAGIIRAITHNIFMC